MICRYLFEEIGRLVKEFFLFCTVYICFVYLSREKVEGMKLREDPSGLLLESLTTLGVDHKNILMYLSSDIGMMGGQFRSGNKIVLTREHLFVFEALESNPFFEIPVTSIIRSRILPTVGSMLFQVLVGSEWIDCVRFSNRHRIRFEKLVRFIENLKKNESSSPDDFIDSIDTYRCKKCGFMLEASGEACPKCIDRGAALSRVAMLMGNHSKAAMTMLFLLLVGVGLDMIWPLLTRYLVDHVLSGSRSGLILNFLIWKKISSKTALLIVVGGLAFVQIMRAGVNTLTGLVSSRVGNLMSFEIRTKLVRKLQELGLAYYSKHDTGSLVGRIAYDTEAIQNFLNQITSGFVMQFLLVIISFGMMFSLQPSLALYAIIPAPLVFGGALAYWKYVHPRFERLWDRSSRQAAVLNGILSGIRVVKAFGQEDGELQRFQKASAQVRDSRRSLDRTGALFYPSMAILFQVGGWVIWYVGGLDVLGGGVSLGTLMAFFGYLSMFYGPLSSLTQLTTWLTEFSTQVHRIFEILDTPTQQVQVESSVSVPSLRGEIEFRNVTFGYHRSRPVIKDLNLKISAGERVGIVGRSGSGKSSLANLLCHFYDPDSGKILLDGIDIQKLGRQDLRKNMSIVLQEPFLFSGTLAENIAYGCPDADLKRIIEVSRAANAHEFIMQRPFAYDTQVGERGQELSGGERQRISIARALLCSPSILILDEATSSVDTESELAVQSAIDEVTRGRTTLIIAHRLSTLLKCDRILVLEDGRIVESGNHWELVGLQGRYAKWVRMQQISTESEKMEQETPKPRWLHPKDSIFSQGSRNDLLLESSTSSSVFPLRCFPIHHPEQYLSIRRFDEKGQVQELGMIEELNEWPKESIQLLHQALGRRYYFQTVKRVYSIRRFSHLLAISACTDFGDSEFVMRNSRGSTRKFGRRGRLLLDVEDNVYMIPDLEKIPTQDREVFSRFVHWE